MEAAVVNAAGLALQDAGVPMRDLVVSASVVVLGERVVVDPTREEAAAGRGGGWYVCYGHTPTEGVSFRMGGGGREGEMGRVWETAVVACKKLVVFLDKRLRDYTKGKCGEME